MLHDYLNQFGGAEKVIFSIKEIYPDSNFSVLIHDKNLFKNLHTATSFINSLPLKKKYKIYMPLFPIAVKLMDLKNPEIILSSSHAWVKNVKKPKNSLHICYCHTPMRYAWDLRDEYIKNENVLFRPFISLFLNYLKYWDKKGSKNVDHFIANSQNVANRIRKFYGRESTVIYPPVDTNFFKLNTHKREDCYLIVCRLIEYKRVDIAINAFNKLNTRLMVVGTGRDEKRLKKIARKNIEFKGYLKGNKLLNCYQNARGFIHPQIEDAGIACLESQSCGTPVIAFAKGGALETVIEGKTGHFFHEQTPEALINAVQEFEKMNFNSSECRKNALKYDKEVFKRKIKVFVEDKYREWKKIKIGDNI